MAKRLFVGGLPYSVTDQELNDLFAPFGVVNSAQVIIDRMSGRSKGFGFVEMANEDEANEAIAKLNDTEMAGRKIAVNEARPRPERSDRDFKPRFDRGGGYGHNDRRGSFRPRRNNNSRGGRY